MSVSREHFHTPVLGTPFHERTAACCVTNEWTRWAGFTTVDCYTDVELEYFAARSRSALFDLSPMIKYRIFGPDAEAYLNRLVTRDVTRLAPGRVAYVLWCNDRGHVQDDGTVFRFSNTEFRLCAQDRHLPWLEDSAFGYDVTIEDESEAVAALALQGPTSCTVLRDMGIEGIEALRPFALREVSIGGLSLMVSRTGFTGDLGYELWTPAGNALALWDRVMEAEGAWGVRPMGSRALDLLRLEAGYLMPHVDFMPADVALRDTRGRSPFELGYERLVDFGKGHFVGRRALLAERARGSKYRIVGLDVDGNRPARDAFVYHGQRREAGHVTSAMWSPTAKRNIAIATLESQYASLGDDLWVEIYISKELKWEKRMERCRIVPRPFFDPPRRRATPAGSN